MQRLKVSLLGSLALVSLLALVAAGCGGGSKKSSTGGGAGTTTTSSSTSGANSAVAALVPSKYKSMTLKVATDATYAPNEFIGSDGQTVEGMDPDLAQALAKVMGIKVKVVNASFDTIIPALASGKYDLSMSSFTDTKERQKVVDFVTYFSAGTSFYVKASGRPDDQLARRSVRSLGRRRARDDAGEPTRRPRTRSARRPGSRGSRSASSPTRTARISRISSGRAQVGMADSPVAAYIVKQSNGQFKLTGKSYGTAPYGIAIPKGNGMAKPILAALKALMSNGTYKAILTKWGVQDGAITNPKINGATS